jgi:hypothetical protein
VADEELRAFAESESTEVRSVLVEVEAPEPQLEVRRGDGGESRPRGRRAVSPDARERKLVEERLDELAARVKSLTGKEPTVLRAARAVVAELTPEQLQEVSRHEHTRAVRPNRRRGAP